MAPRESLRRRALRLAHSGGNDVFLFSLCPADLLAIAAPSLDQSQSLGDLLKQPVVRQHVNSIRAGLGEENALMLTTIVLGLTPDVRFRSSRGPDVSDGLSTAGTLEIPLQTRAGRKPAWLLDGYYRVLALGENERSDFAVPVCAIVADDPALLRQQFDRIHNTRPLPPEIPDLLFPRGTVPISPRLGPQELPDAVCNWLNNDPESPFRGLVGAKKEAKGAQFPALRAALRAVVAEALSSPYGGLFPYRNIATGETDVNGLCNAVKTYWSAVKAVFTDAWGKTPKTSRLMHPVGIRTMGRLMNRVLPAIDLSADDRLQQTIAQLEKIRPVCHWTAGVWEELDGLRWDKVEATPRHVNLLSNFLVRAYLAK